MNQEQPSQERLKRTALSAALWLAQLILFLPDALKLPRSLKAFVERRLTLLEAFVADLVMIRAAHLHRTQARMRDRARVARAQSRHDVRANVRHSMRAAMGSRLRRTLKARGDLKARARAILHNLEHQDQLARICIRRMRRSGLSRRMSGHTRVKAQTLPRPASVPIMGGLHSVSVFAEDLRGALAPP